MWDFISFGAIIRIETRNRTGRQAGGRGFLDRNWTLLLIFLGSPAFFIFAIIEFIRWL
ncbi:hypothetical protein [Martelella sp. HB161492]|uniref:hypothetical protein n=1 Tax=Martelella sp. HB161492 TaxID=2720726 RepID=UPI001590A726|nr:hypothetical protein [Martelella sp. HB161492]